LTTFIGLLGRWRQRAAFAIIAPSRLETVELGGHFIRDFGEPLLAGETVDSAVGCTPWLTISEKTGNRRRRQRNKWKQQ
jgi:hypothetical protein